MRLRRRAWPPPLPVLLLLLLSACTEASAPGPRVGVYLFDLSTPATGRAGDTVHIGFAYDGMCVPAPALDVRVRPGSVTISAWITRDQMPFACPAMLRPAPVELNIRPDFEDGEARVVFRQPNGADSVRTIQQVTP